MSIIYDNMTNAGVDANRQLSANSIIRTAYGLGEMINLAPAPAAVDYNNRRAGRKLFGARPARPIYRDHAMNVNR